MISREALGVSRSGVDCMTSKSAKMRPMNKSNGFGEMLCSSGEA